jgi:hypothetical protein
MLKPFWVSWWYAGAFTLEAPWWVSGFRLMEDGDNESICAAIMARDEGHARDLVGKAHDDGGVGIEWRFVEERSAGWEPFTDRFPQAHWMRWPWPEQG